MVYRVSYHLKILSDVTLLDIFVFVVFDLNYFEVQNITILYQNPKQYKKIEI